MELSSYRRRGFRPFCIEEIRYAYEHGIDPELIEQYMNDTAFNNMQLMQIRLGLESGIDVSAYARVTMPDEDMEKIRLRLEDEKKNRNLEKEEKEKLEKQKTKGEVKKLRLHNTISFFRVILILAGIGIAAVIALVFRRLYDWYSEELFITFVKDEIALEYKEPFVPERYVREHSDGENIIVIYPSFEADELGEYTVTYQLSNGLKSIRKDLKIRVADTIAPVIRLKTDEIGLIRDIDEFVPEDYIEEMTDNYDPDLKLAVDEINWDLDEQEIVYRVTDSCGNSSQAVLKVLIEDKPAEKPKPAATASSYSESGSDSAGSYSPPADNSGSNDDSKPQTSVPEPEASGVNCHNVSVPLGTDPGTAAYMTYDGLYGNISVSIQYPELNTSSPGTYPVYYINQSTGETIAVAYVTVSE